MECCIEDFQRLSKTKEQELKENEDMLNITVNRIVKMKKEISNSFKKYKSELANSQQEIENLKKQMGELQEEIVELNDDKSIARSRFAPQCCKLITGFSLVKSDGSYLGASIENPTNVFRYKTEDPNIVSNLWSKVERQ